MKVWLACISLILSAEMLAAEQAMAPHPITAIPYTPILSGVANFTIRAALMDHLDLFVFASKPPHTLADLKERLASDLKSALQCLEELGYYNARVSYSIDLKTRPIVVNFMVELGPLYTLGDFSMTSSEPNDLIIKQVSLMMPNFGISRGLPATADRVRDAIKQAFVFFGNHGYPYAKTKHEEAVVDHTNRTVNIKMTIDPGPIIRFGDIRIKSNPPGLDPRAVIKFLKWHKGDIYSNMLVMETVEALQQTQKYAFVKITRPQTPPPDGIALVEIDVISAETRPFAWSAGYDSTSGANGSLGWKGLSIFTEGDEVKIEGSLGEKKSGLYYQHNVTDVLWANSVLSHYVNIERLKNDAFTLFQGEFAAMLSSPIVGQLSGEIGFKASIQQIKKIDGKRHTPFLLGIPMGVRYVSYDRPLSPRQGWDLLLDISPGMELAPNRLFFQATILQHLYWPLTEDKRLVAMGWYFLGMSPGVGKDTLPLSKRFYAGGNGMAMVRGYEDMMAGPVDKNGVPMGGRSSLAFGAALHYYFTDKLMVKGFFDAGTAFESRYPNLGHKIFTSFGSGLSYQLSNASINLDLAVPVNRRAEDKKAQIYLTVGQPF